MILKRLGFVLVGAILLGWIGYALYLDATRIPSALAARPDLVINEVMPKNESTLEDRDEPGAYPDYIELYNRGPITVSLEGLHITDDPRNLTKYRFPTPILIPPDDFLILYADDDEEQGSLHLRFNLNDDEPLLLVDRDGETIIDRIDSVGDLDGDEVWQRPTDGFGAFERATSPTPGRSNVLAGPRVSALWRSSDIPAEGEAVAVTAVVTDDVELTSVALVMTTDGEMTTTLEMALVATDTYRAEIPARPDGSLVQYAVVAQDNDRVVGYGPARAPAEPAGYEVGYRPPALWINEFMAENNQNLVNPAAPERFDDWIELYNSGSTVIDLNGYYLTDNLNNLTKHRISGTLMLEPGQFLLLYADNRPERGVEHLRFQLEKGGEGIALTAPNGYHTIDVQSFLTQTGDISFGRAADGEPVWQAFRSPTPGRSNGLQPPYVESVVHTPEKPLAGEPITVTARISTAADIMNGTLYYYRHSEEGERWEAIPLTPIEPFLYVAILPAGRSGDLFEYYLEFEDTNRLTTGAPFAAPDALFRYVVDYRPPTLQINEVMPSNRTAYEDPDKPGSYPDWFELVNFGSEPVDLSGFYLTDDLDNRTRFKIVGPMVVGPGETALFFADNDPQEGGNHLNFRLNSQQELVALYDRDENGRYLIDLVEIEAVGIDTSLLRCPDRSWVLGDATPGEAGPGGACGGLYLPLVVNRRLLR